jgi:hypothetical protein
LPKTAAELAKQRNLCQQLPSRGSSTSLSNCCCYAAPSKGGTANRSSGTSARRRPKWRPWPRTPLTAWNPTSWNRSLSPMSLTLRPSHHSAQIVGSQSWLPSGPGAPPAGACRARRLTRGPKQPLACDWRSSTFFSTPAQAAKMSPERTSCHTLPVTGGSIRRRRRCG